MNVFFACVFLTYRKTSTFLKKIDEIEVAEKIAEHSFSNSGFGMENPRPKMLWECIRQKKVLTSTDQSVSALLSLNKTRMKCESAVTGINEFASTPGEWANVRS